jgi:hypothetical protein
MRDASSYCDHPLAFLIALTFLRKLFFWERWKRLTMRFSRLYSITFILELMLANIKHRNSFVKKLLVWQTWRK